MAEEIIEEKTPTPEEVEVINKVSDETKVIENNLYPFPNEQVSSPALPTPQGTEPLTPTLGGRKPKEPKKFDKRHLGKGRPRGRPVTAKYADPPPPPAMPDPQDWEIIFNKIIADIPESVPNKYKFVTEALERAIILYKIKQEHGWSPDVKIILNDWELFVNKYKDLHAPTDETPTT